MFIQVGECVVDVEETCAIKLCNFLRGFSKEVIPESISDDTPLQIPLDQTLGCTWERIVHSMFYSGKVVDFGYPLFSTISGYNLAICDTGKFEMWDLQNYLVNQVIEHNLLSPWPTSISLFRELFVHLTPNNQLLFRNVVAHSLLEFAFGDSLLKNRIPEWIFCCACLKVMDTIHDDSLILETIPNRLFLFIKDQMRCSNITISIYEEEYFTIELSEDCMEKYGQKINDLQFKEFTQITILPLYTGKGLYFVLKILVGTRERIYGVNKMGHFLFLFKYQVAFASSINYAINSNCKIPIENASFATSYRVISLEKIKTWLAKITDWNIVIENIRNVIVPMGG